MKIVIFTENNHCGGMDTFYPTLINNWPYPEDELVFICNKSHPGLSNIRRDIKTDCRVIEHEIPLNWVLSKKLFAWLPYFLRRASQPFLRVLILPLQYFKIKSLFESIDAERLLVVNGGYPGGESCRLANIVWSDLGRFPGVHNIRNFAINPRFMFRWYERKMDQILIKKTSYFIGVSKICAESLRIRSEFKHENKIKFIYNGLDLSSKPQKSKIIFREKYNIPKDGQICLMLATYEARKGHELLFNAIKLVHRKMPNTHFIICGDGTDEEIAKVENLRNKITPNSNIYLDSFIADAKELISQADILLIASQIFESFGWTAIEAMRVSVPIVSTNTGGLPEVIGEDGNCGYTVDPNDAQSYAEKILLILKNDLMRKQMGIRGQERVLTLFNSKRMVKEYADLVYAHE